MSRDACIELARSAGRDPEELVEWWAERAAVREFDGGQARAAAESAALDDVRISLAGPRLGPKRAESSAPSAAKRELK